MKTPKFWETSPWKTGAELRELDEREYAALMEAVINDAESPTAAGKIQLPTLRLRQLRFWPLLQEPTDPYQQSAVLLRIGAEV